MKPKKRRSLKLTAVLMSLMVAVAFMPSFAFADTAADATVYMTVSEQGAIAQAKDGSMMMQKKVTVKDLDADGQLTFDEALVAGHEAYYEGGAEGYVLGEVWGSPGVTKLWGKETTNCLFVTNNEPIATGVTADTVKDGDFLNVSVNKDDVYFADWYVYFDKNQVSAKVGEKITLNLKGFLGMSWDKDENGNINESAKKMIPDNLIYYVDKKTGDMQLGKTDENGAVTFSFDKAGTYCVTASGTAKDTVTVDWTTYETAEVDCPIIAPDCVITVSKVANTMTVAAKKSVTVKYAKVKKAKQTIAKSKVFTVKKAKGDVTFTKYGGSAKLKIGKKTGKITVKKGTKKGTYTIKVKVKAAGTDKFKSKTVKKTIKVKVK